MTGVLKKYYRESEVSPFQCLLNRRTHFYHNMPLLYAYSKKRQKAGKCMDNEYNYYNCRQPPLTVIRAILSGQTGTSPAINRYAAKGSLHE